MHPADETIRRIIEISPGLHNACALLPQALRAIVRHAQGRRIHHSVETGAGASTLLLSHLSDRHTVFALDNNNGSITNIQNNPLLRPGVVTFVEGPTQQTLPSYQFPSKLALALIDGPHAYPFPDLEYYYVYPHLEPGALLILDDIHIRTIHNLFAFLKRDAMFRLDEVVHTTAFFTRTEAPAFDPLGDGWWEQKYNQRPVAQYIWRQRISKLFPSRPPRNSGGAEVKITAPHEGDTVGATGKLTGMALLPPEGSLWILVHRKDLPDWWIQGPGPINLYDANWEIAVNYGEPHDIGYDFEIAALVVSPAIHEFWTTRRTVKLPARESIYAEAYRTARKVSHV